MPSALKTFLYCLKLLDDDTSAAVNKAYDIPIDKVLRCMALVECMYIYKYFFYSFSFRFIITNAPYIWTHL